MPPKNKGPSKEIIPAFIVTTSQRKFDHLEYLGEQQNLNQEYGVELHLLPWEYQEIQSDKMGLLLTEAIKRKTFDGIRDSFFIIEQTSVFLDAKGGEGPGQYFKKWWETKSEEELKMVLSRNPGARIESGLALNVPGHDPLIFTNTQKGKIDLDGNIREENKQYSWLSADDFNLYFVPQGSNKVYNEMPINEFGKYDFRKPNFDKISERLGEYASILKKGLTINNLQNIADEYLPDEEKAKSNQTDLSNIGRDSKQTSLEDLRDT